MAVRMHAAILSLGAQTPVLSIAINEKAPSLFRQMMLEEWCISAEASITTPEIHNESLSRLWTESESVSTDIAARLP